MSQSESAAPSPRHRPNVFIAEGPSRQALDLIADKWTMLVIKALAEGVQRYGDVQRTVGGISQKMLTQTLGALERNGPVGRTAYPVVPPMVEYRLTPLGTTLIEPLGAIAAWAERHMDAVATARHRNLTPDSTVPGRPDGRRRPIRYAHSPIQKIRTAPDQYPYNHASGASPHLG